MENKELEILLQNLRYLANLSLDEEDIINDVETYVGSYILPNLSHPNSLSVVKDDLIRMRETSRRILNSIIKQVDKSIKDLSKVKNSLSDINLFRDKYPYYVNIKDPKESLIFFDSLKKEEYSYVETAEILNLSRQTISNYVKENLHGFKLEEKKKKITREQIYKYYLSLIK